MRPRGLRPRKDGELKLSTRLTVLITGATDGIGRALAGIYRARGDRLVLVGRRALDSLQGGLFSDETLLRGGPVRARLRGQSGSLSE